MLLLVTLYLFMMKHSLLNEKKWFSIPKTPREINLKKQTIRAIIAFSDSTNTSYHKVGISTLLFSLMKDLDFCVAILSQYSFQYEKLEDLAPVKKHFSSIKKAKYILSYPMLGKIQDILFTLHPSLTIDKELAVTLLKKNDKFSHYFPELLNDYSFITQCLKKNIVSTSFFQFYPYDQKITKHLLVKGIYPNQQNNFYNQDVLNDKKFVLSLLLKSHGDRLYFYLFYDLQNDLDLCDQIKEKHPHCRVKASSINTVEKFISSIKPNSNFSDEIYTILRNMQEAPFIIESPFAIAKVLIHMAKLRSICYVDAMGGQSFDNHPIQSFFYKMSQIHPIIKDFLFTEFGKNFVYYPIFDYQTFHQFEQTIFLDAGVELEKFLQYHFLEENLSTHDSIKKNKI